MLVVIVHLIVIVIDTEAVVAVMVAVVDILEEMTKEKDLVFAHEAEVQKDSRTELIDMVVVVMEAVEIDQEIVWVVAAEEIDINLPS